MILTITHIDQVYVLQESLESSRSKASKSVLSKIDSIHSSWPRSGRAAASVLPIDDSSELPVVVRSLRKFIAKCDPVTHWRAVEVAERLGVA
jgi:hypothetical protein